MSLNKSEKLMYRSHRGIRKALIAASADKRDPRNKGYMQLTNVAKPDYLVRCDGVRVKYEGP